MTDEQIVAQIDAYHRVIGSASIQSYMPATRQKAIAHWREMTAKNEKLASAAKAVVDRWDTPKWKDAEPTADTVNELRAALKAREAQG